jgi:large subunit ribosomal protein L30
LPSRKLRITLTRSLIGLTPGHVRTLRALGLRRIRATVVHDDTPAIRGMIAQVPYAVRVEPDVDRPAGAGAAPAAREEAPA